MVISEQISNRPRFKSSWKIFKKKSLKTKKTCSYQQKELYARLTLKSIDKATIFANYIMLTF